MKNEALARLFRLIDEQSLDGGEMVRLLQAGTRGFPDTEEIDDCRDGIIGTIGVFLCLLSEGDRDEAEKVRAMLLSDLDYIVQLAGVEVGKRRFH